MQAHNIGRGILILVSLFFISTGVVLMFSPQNMLTHMYIGSIDSPAELSSIRAIWGGSVIAVWAAVLYGAVTNKTELIVIGLACLLLVVVGRLVGIYSDGLFPELSANLLPTVVSILLMLVALKLMALVA